MNDKTIEDVNNSNVILADYNTTIYNNLSFDDVHKLFKLLIEKEMTLFREEVRVEAEKRFNEIKEMIFAEVTKHDDRLLEKLKNMQF